MSTEKDGLRIEYETSKAIDENIPYFIFLKYMHGKVLSSMLFPLIKETTLNFTVSDRKLALTVKEVEKKGRKEVYIIIEVTILGVKMNSSVDEYSFEKVQQQSSPIVKQDGQCLIYGIFPVIGQANSFIRDYLSGCPSYKWL